MIRLLLAAAVAVVLSSCGIAQGVASRATGALNYTTRTLMSPIRRMSDTPEQLPRDAAHFTREAAEDRDSGSSPPHGH